MNNKRLSNHLVVIVLIVILISGCSSTDSSPTPIPTKAATPEPAKPSAPSASPPVLEVTFDGDECNYEGPGSVPQGKVSLILHNPGDEEYWADVLGLGESKTWDDLVAYFGPPGSEKSGPPVWAEGINVATAYPLQTTDYSRFLLAGDYAVICILPSDIPYRHWIGAPLTVEK